MAVSGSNIQIFNQNIPAANRFSLRNNKVGPIISGQLKKIAEEGPIILNDGSGRVIREPFPGHLGDLFGEGGHSTPTPIEDAIKWLIDTRQLNYSASNGYASTVKALAEYYRITCGVNLNQNRIFLTEGVTGSLALLGRLFMNTPQAHMNGAPAPTFLSGSIFYPPSIGMMVLYGLTPQFLDVDSKHAPILRRQDVQPSTLFLNDYSVGNPGGMAKTEDMAYTTAEQIKIANDRREVPIFWVVDHAYADLIDPKKLVNYLKIAEKLEVPLILMGGKDKPLGTGFHAGWSIAHIPEKYPELGAAFDQSVAGVNGFYLGTNSISQFAIIIADSLANAGYSAKEIEGWFANLKKGEAPPLKPDTVSRGGEYDLENLFESLLTIKDSVAANLQKSWVWTRSFLEALSRYKNQIEVLNREMDIPYYVLTRVNGGPWADSEQFAIDFANSTGVGVTHIKPFVSDGALPNYGISTRTAIVKIPEIMDPYNTGEVANVGDIMGRFVVEKKNEMQ